MKTRSSGSRSVGGDRDGAKEWKKVDPMVRLEERNLLPPWHREHVSDDELAHFKKLKGSYASDSTDTASNSGHSKRRSYFMGDAEDRYLFGVHGVENPPAHLSPIAGVRYSMRAGSHSSQRARSSSALPKSGSMEKNAVKWDANEGIMRLRASPPHSRSPSPKAPSKRISKKKAKSKRKKKEKRGSMSKLSRSKSSRLLKRFSSSSSSSLISSPALQKQDTMPRQVIAALVKRCVLYSPSTNAAFQEKSIDLSGYLRRKSSSRIAKRLALWKRLYFVLHLPTTELLVFDPKQNYVLQEAIPLHNIQALTRQKYRTFGIGGVVKKEKKTCLRWYTQKR